MLTENDRAVLDEAYRSCTMGNEAINAIVGKVTDEKLALDLNRQACRYSSLTGKVTEKMAGEKETPKCQKPQKAVLWAEMQMNTLADTSTEHVAELMIRTNTMAITEMMKTLKANKGAKKEYCELADEIMDFEEKNIETLKCYLK